MTTRQKHKLIFLRLKYLRGEERGEKEGKKGRRKKEKVFFFFPRISNAYKINFTIPEPLCRFLLLLLLRKINFEQFFKKKKGKKNFFFCLFFLFFI